MSAPTRTSAYDQYAAEYAAYVATREQTGLDSDPFGILPVLLAQLGDVAGQDILDAGCGEGYLSRVLAARGARVTGVDLAPRLVELAGQKLSPGQPITYRVGDRHGPSLHWWSNGKPETVAEYADDKVTRAKNWDREGKLVSDDEFEADGSRKIKR